jgi:hypothetical protein
MVCTVYRWPQEFFTVPYVFLPESAGIQVIPGILGEWNFSRGACKIIISILAEFLLEFKFRRNGHRNNRNRITPGIQVHLY